MSTCCTLAAAHPSPLPFRSTSEERAHESDDVESFESADDIDSAPPEFTRRASGNVVTLQYRAPEARSRARDAWCEAADDDAAGVREWGLLLFWC